MTPDALRTLLAAHDVSQRELARRLRVSQSTVFRWACDRAPMTWRDWMAVKHVVECATLEESRVLK